MSTRTPQGRLLGPGPRTDATIGGWELQAPALRRFAAALGVQTRAPPKCGLDQGFGARDQTAQRETSNLTVEGPADATTRTQQVEADVTSDWPRCCQVPR